MVPLDIPTSFLGRDFVLDGNNLKSYLCDKSYIDVNIINSDEQPYAGENVNVIHDCTNIPVFEECGKGKKSSKGGKKSKPPELFH